MSSRTVIAIGWLTFGVSVLPVGIWSFSNMGNCPAGMICQRPWSLDAAIFRTGLVVWLAGCSLIRRRKKA